MNGSSESPVSDPFVGLRRRDIAIVLGLNAAVLLVAWLPGWLERDASAVLQTLVLVDTLWIVYLYTRATFRLARSAEQEVSILRQKLLSDVVRDLTEQKPIVFTDRVSDGYEISNVGDAFAANVWYVEANNQPTPLGSLGKGASRRIPFTPAERHVLIAEARPVNRRKWTPTFNARSHDTVAHGFITLKPDALEYRGSLTGFLATASNELAQLSSWNPIDGTTAS